MTQEKTHVEAEGTRGERQQSSDPGTRTIAEHQEEAQNRIDDRKEARVELDRKRQACRTAQGVIATVLVLISGFAWVISASQTQPTDYANTIAAFSACAAALIVIWRGD